MSESIKIQEKDLETVSGGENQNDPINDLVIGNFYYVEGNTAKLFKVVLLNKATGMVVCGIYDYDSATDTATNTKASTTNYKASVLKAHNTPSNIIL